MRESEIEKKLCDYAAKCGWDNIKIIKRGYPDRQFLQKGYVFFIEFKRKNKPLTMIQQLTSQHLIAQGFNVFLCDDIEQGKRIIDEETRRIST
jgi:hypothetical protein